ncbi:protein of unknown function DUF159 (plasmid) [Prosthecochloris aestuarii DSM 271]|uniref:Abasic site processing protein n=1 Tax=Prosthecochloris aestuarii (strain DSM 271 / SK 413) TaxID=290512 RepID=B4S9M5_PROA2|nr:SOS response-associated peptidase [Prosthecochloris aestuarii]ACF47352.1 protein of unknown function DUF159 [Prosthecochloris aestuarii DSM 271]
MCGRYVLFISLKDLARIFRVTQLSFEFSASYNIAPTQTVPIVTGGAERSLVPARWGFVPSWAEDMSIGQRMINARSETVAEKPAFRKAFHSHRCIVPANGFYEWKQVGRSKQPVYIHLRSDRVMAMAGIFNTWTSPDGVRLVTFAVITTPSNDLVKPIHNRMPAILHEGDYEMWLDPGTSAEKHLAGLLQSLPSDELDAYEVSTRVNIPANDSSDNIQPLQTGLGL